MTKEEAILQLKEANFYPTEGGHIYADNILRQFIISLGYSDVVEAYDKIKKWYS